MPPFPGSQPSRGLRRDHQHTTPCSLTSASTLNDTSYPFPITRISTSRMTDAIDFIQNVSQTRAPETHLRLVNANTIRPPNHTSPSLTHDAPDDESECDFIGGPFAITESDLGSPTTLVHTLGVQGLESPNSTISDHLRRIYGLVFC